MKLGIFCAGSLGIEVLSIVEDEEMNFDGVFFIDDVTEETCIKGKSVYKSEEFFSKFEPDEIKIIIATGEPIYRKKIYDKIKQNGFSLETIISKTSSLYSKESIGEGVIIFPNCYVGEGVEISENVVIHAGCNIVEGVKIDSHSFLSLGCFIGSRTKVGKYCFVGPNASVSDNLCVSDKTIIGIGSVVINNPKESSVYVGNPARFLRTNETGLIFQ